MAVQRRRRRRPKKHVDFLNSVRPLYEKMLEAQGGVCGICGRPPNPVRRHDIDHHHSRMVVRGILCPSCNRVLRDWMTPEWARAAADYLERDGFAWLEEELKALDPQ